MPISVKKRKWAPSANHPWHQGVRREVQKRASKVAATASRSTFLELPGSNFLEQNYPGKKKRQNRKKGTFLKSFDTPQPES
jgi:hypothetical protein